MNIKELIKRAVGERMLGVADYCLRGKSTTSWGWGGPFNGQTFRQEIFLELIEKIDFSAIAETGTFRGTTRSIFMHPHSCLYIRPSWRQGFIGMQRLDFARKETSGSVWRQQVFFEASCEGPGAHARQNVFLP